MRFRIGSDVAKVRTVSSSIPFSIGGHLEFAPKMIEAPPIRHFDMKVRGSPSIRPNDQIE